MQPIVKEKTKQLRLGMKKIIAAFLLFTALSSYAEMQALAEDEDSIFYYNPADVVMNQGLVYTSFLINYKGPQQARIWGGMKIFNSTITLIALDCPKKVYRTNSIKVFEGNFGAGQMVGALTSSDDPTFDVWQPFPREREKIISRILSKIRGVCKS